MAQQMPQYKRVFVTSSEALFDIDVVDMREAMLRNYDLKMPSQTTKFRKQINTLQGLEKSGLYDDNPELNEWREFKAGAEEHTRQQQALVTAQKQQALHELEEMKTRMVALRKDAKAHPQLAQELQGQIDELGPQMQQRQRELDDLIKREKALDPRLIPDEQLVMCFYLVRGDLGDQATVFGVSNHLAQFTQGKLDELDLPEGSERRIARTGHDMIKYFSVDPDHETGETILPGVDYVQTVDSLNSQKPQKLRNFEKFKPGQTVGVTQKKSFGRKKTVQIDPIESDWKQSQQELIRNPNQSLPSLGHRGKNMYQMEL